jgi:hypothetical protein
VLRDLSRDSQDHGIYRRRGWGENDVRRSAQVGNRSEVFVDDVTEAAGECSDSVGHACSGWKVLEAAGGVHLAGLGWRTSDAIVTCDHGSHPGLGFQMSDIPRSTRSTPRLEPLYIDWLLARCCVG